MSDTTDRLRQVAEHATPGEMYAGGRNADHFAATFDPVLVAAMLDVIDAAEGMRAREHAPVKRQLMYEALARFREVAG